LAKFWQHWQQAKNLHANIGQRKIRQLQVAYEIVARFPPQP
jgi:hypothetical protein